MTCFVGLSHRAMAVVIITKAQLPDSRPYNFSVDNKITTARLYRRCSASPAQQPKNAVRHAACPLSYTHVGFNSCWRHAARHQAQHTLDTHIVTGDKEQHAHSCAKQTTKTIKLMVLKRIPYLRGSCITQPSCLLCSSMSRTAPNPLPQHGTSYAVHQLMPNKSNRTAAGVAISFSPAWQLHHAVWRAAGPLNHTHVILEGSCKLKQACNLFCGAQVSCNASTTP
jgi:hypothetical protein